MGANELPIEMTSLWESTAPGWDHQRLDGDADADVAIVGAGITGLAAALRVAESGRSVIVLDTAHPGWGASGRNGGQVIPGLKIDPDAIADRFGEGLVAFAGDTADAVFRIIRQYQIDCLANRGGWIQPAYTAATMRTLSARCAQWQARGAEVEMLDRHGVGDALGSQSYVGGFLDRRAGSLHPLKYTMGLGAAARGLGARVFSHAAVTAIERCGDRYALRTAAGTVTADRVLLCANGYTDPAFGPVGRSYVPIASIQIATEPLPATLRQAILRDHVCASDTNRLLVYYRLDTDGRFLIGGRGATFRYGLSRLFGQLQARAIKIFPDLAEVAWPYRWGGLVALTSDHLPHVHEPAPGLVMALGYNGRGVALATSMGAAIADYALSGDESALPLPLTPIRRLPLHRLRTVGLEVASAWFALRDRMDAIGQGQKSDT
jgi:glycine/D-amino acid oxidase-like deaminating enzyme